MDAESRSIPAKGMAINERCGWRLAQRTKEDARGEGKNLREVESSQTTGLTYLGALSLWHSEESPVYQVLKYVLSYFGIPFQNGSIRTIKQIL